MSGRIRAGWVILAAFAALVVFAPASGATIACPASANASAADALGPVQWAFSVLGAPTSGAPGVTSTYTHGAGTWNNARATGTVCTDDSGGGKPRRHLVLNAAGPSRLSPHITKFGLLGVGIVIPVRVAKTDDSACPMGTTGTVTLFASYYSVHRDSIALHFAAACSTHDHTFTGSAVKVLIARNGAQVNAA